MISLDHFGKEAVAQAQEEERVCGAHADVTWIMEPATEVNKLEIKNDFQDGCDIKDIVESIVEKVQVIK